MKIQEREKRKKLKEAVSEGKIKKKSKAQVEETLKKLTKGGKAKVLTVSVLLCSLSDLWVRDFSAINLGNILEKVMMGGMFILQGEPISSSTESRFNAQTIRFFLNS